MNEKDKKQDLSNNEVMVNEGENLNPEQLLLKATAPLTDDHMTNGFFISKPTNDWIQDAKNRPIPEMLFDEFWFEGEVSILFGDTNQGKSVLAVQIANSISSGNPIHGFDLGVNKQKVLYFDFELSDKQFELRYSIRVEGNTNNHFIFDRDFMRVEVSPDAAIPQGNYEENIMANIKGEVLSNETKVVIIDNLTWLILDAEKAKEASKFMKSLQKFAKDNGLSILVLAHTPKIDSSKPLSLNHLQGSKMISNFCSSVFVIGRSFRSSKTKYLKQLKVRNSGYQYTEDNVVVLEIDKRNNFLGFERVQSEEPEFYTEIYHLQPHSALEREERNKLIIAGRNNGKSLRELGELHGMSHVNAKKIIDAFEDEDEVPF